MIKIIAFSDPHGQLPTITEPFDLMLICGDICPAHDHFNWYQREWLSTTFVEWVLGLPFKDKASKVIFIGGNHDRYLDEEPNPNQGYSSIYTDVIKPCGGRLVYLEDDEYIFEKETEDGKTESLKIYGTPWCKIFGRWWFMRDDRKLEQLYDNIPEGLDILMTHDMPDIQGCAKITFGPWAGENAGNSVLAAAIKKKEPKLVLSGHIHSASHTLTKVYKKDTRFRCVSILDEDYYPLYEPYVFTMEGHVKE